MVVSHFSVQRAWPHRSTQPDRAAILSLATTIADRSEVRLFPRLSALPLTRDVPALDQILTFWIVI